MILSTSPAQPVTYSNVFPMYCLGRSVKWRVNNESSTNSYRSYHSTRCGSCCKLPSLSFNLKLHVHIYIYTFLKMYMRDRKLCLERAVTDFPKQSTNTVIQTESCIYVRSKFIHITSYIQYPTLINSISGAQVRPQHSLRSPWLFNFLQLLLVCKWFCIN